MQYTGGGRGVILPACLGSGKKRGTWSSSDGPSQPRGFHGSTMIGMTMQTSILPRSLKLFRWSTVRKSFSFGDNWWPAFGSGERKQVGIRQPFHRWSDSLRPKLLPKFGVACRAGKISRCSTVFLANCTNDLFNFFLNWSLGVYGKNCRPCFSSILKAINLFFVPNFFNLGNLTTEDLRFLRHLSTGCATGISHLVSAKGGSVLVRWGTGNQGTTDHVQAEIPDSPNTYKVST